MRNILARVNRPILQQFMWSNVLVAFDYDGTLAPIGLDPARAHMRPRTRALLERLGELRPVAVISGRRRPDVQDKLHGIRVQEVIGNHGVPPRARVNAAHVAQVRGWRPVLEACVRRFRGVTIEDKGVSVAIHYRRCRERKLARAAILQAAATLADVRVIRGKLVVDILPRGAPHKGLALERLRDQLRCDTALYVGDDETDEDVFRLDHPGRLLSIRVGRRARSAAAYYLVSQAATDDLLATLVDYSLTSNHLRPF